MGAVEVKPWASHSYQVCEIKQLIDPLPGQNLCQCISTCDEVHLLVRKLGTQIGEGVDSERWTAAVDIYPAGGEPRVGRSCDDGHEIAVFGRADRTLIFLPRDSGRHKHDLIQPETCLHLAGGHQMTMMDRVEGAPHDPKSPPGHGRSLGEPFVTGSGRDKLTFTGLKLADNFSAWSEQ